MLEVIMMEDKTIGIDYETEYHNAQENIAFIQEEYKKIYDQLKAYEQRTRY